MEKKTEFTFLIVIYAIMCLEIIYGIKLNMFNADALAGLSLLINT